MLPEDQFQQKVWQDDYEWYAECIVGNAQAIFEEARKVNDLVFRIGLQHKQVLKQNKILDRGDMDEIDGLYHDLVMQKLNMEELVETLEGWGTDNE